MEKNEVVEETRKRVVALVAILWGSVLCGAGAVVVRAVMGLLGVGH
jgi:hypothetical protein